MTAIAPITGKIAPLVRLLSSPVDGEVVGAARAIGRVLDAADLDFHWLADRVERLPVVVERPRQEHQPEPELRPWQIAAMGCIRSGIGRLKPAKLDFLRSTIHWPSEPSEKQARWLPAIGAALVLEVEA